MTIEFKKVANRYGNGPATTYTIISASGEVVGCGGHSNRPFAPWTLLVGDNYTTFKSKSDLLAYVEAM